MINLSLKASMKKHKLKDNAMPESDLQRIYNYH